MLYSTRHLARLYYDTRIIMAENPMTNREAWAIRAVLAVFAFFTLFGIYLLFYPTDLLTDIFGVLLLVTLGLGVIFGMITVYTS